MTTTIQPEHYLPAQKILHWITVLGVIIQIAIHEPIVRVNEAIQNGVTANSGDEILAWMHVAVGTTVLFSVLLRLYLRFRYGVPDHVTGTSKTQAKIANIMHWTLYALLLGMVSTGMLTWNGIAQLGDVHFIFNVILFFLVLGHAAAAFYNHFAKRDGTLRRMYLSEKNRVDGKQL